MEIRDRKGDRFLFLTTRMNDGQDVHVQTRANGSLPRTMHGEEKEEEEEEEDTRKCIRFESYSRNTASVSRLVLEGRRGDELAWLAGWPFASSCILRAAHT